MKKALIIFGISMALIISGGLITATELLKWNKTDQTFEEIGFETKKVTIDIDITAYGAATISDHILFNQTAYNYYSELETKIVIDNNQPEGKLKYELIFYPTFGYCVASPKQYAIKNNRLYFNAYDGYHYIGNNHHFEIVERFPENSQINLDLASYCYQDIMVSRRFIGNLLEYDTFKKIMKAKKLPVNLQQAIITINPNDQNKLIK
ncbi:MAG: hypothetical protein GX769_00990 [Erysipelothrix sp.]|nr:hypothetical protein [Erysipelothrix sp.]